MNNSDLPAMPSIEKINPDVIAQAKAVGKIIKHEIQHQGLTKREHFASMAMQGLAADGRFAGTLKQMAVTSVAWADELLEELEK